MGKTALITGGAGFIGSHLARELLERGLHVRALDALVPQVHGRDRSPPDYLDPDVELIRGDVCDPEAVTAALEGVDYVFHMAALVGVGQSMYQMAEYTRVNNLGTAVLLEALAERPVERLVVASSMSIYGEGLYRAGDGRLHTRATRSEAQLERGQWEPEGPAGESLEPVPTPEDKPPALESVYALSKFDQERLSLMVGRAYDIPVVALRFFNIYGPHQALSNPYTGVLAIFAARLLNGNPPLIFEDGRQMRDFVNVRDVARACRLAMEVPEAAGEVFNVSSGSPMSVLDVASRLATALGRTDVEPQVTQGYRVGDIRHCFADVEKVRRVLGFEPRVPFEEGLAELASWLEGQVADDHVDQARDELLARGLVV